MTPVIYNQYDSHTRIIKNVNKSKKQMYPLFAKGIFNCKSNTQPDFNFPTYNAIQFQTIDRREFRISTFAINFYHSLHPHSSPELSQKHRALKLLSSILFHSFSLTATHSFTLTRKSVVAITITILIKRNHAGAPLVFALIKKICIAG